MQRAIKTTKRSDCLDIAVRCSCLLDGQDIETPALLLRAHHSKGPASCCDWRRSHQGGHECRDWIKGWTCWLLKNMLGIDRRQCLRAQRAFLELAVATVQAKRNFQITLSLQQVRPCR